ncbi:uncharacterized protein LOC118407741 [Branchiostoma floridae]|uniref:Uncharacterized protein LOC118407741 n=1 Tax=Branchiostoma floridae TaxID=7739 RepID=A0A9J7HQZ9_BRAFL|nr:uncharacterized protein LOC118407741 [Branchiostoma floridae]
MRLEAFVASSSFEQKTAEVSVWEQQQTPEPSAEVSDGEQQQLVKPPVDISDGEQQQTPEPSAEQPIAEPPVAISDGEQQQTAEPPVDISDEEQQQTAEPPAEQPIAEPPVDISDGEQQQTAGLSAELSDGEQQLTLEPPAEVSDGDQQLTLKPPAEVSDGEQQLRLEPPAELSDGEQQLTAGPPAELSDEEELFMPRTAETETIQETSSSGNVPGMADGPELGSAGQLGDAPELEDVRPELGRAESDILSDHDTLEEEEEKAVEADDEMSSVMSSEAGTEEKQDGEERLAEMDASWEYTNSFVYHTSGVRSLSDSNTDRPEDTADDFTSKLLLRSESEPWTRADPSEEDLTPTVAPDDDVPYRESLEDLAESREDSPDITPISAKDFLQEKMEPMEGSVRKAYEEPTRTSQVKRSERPKAPLRSLSMGQPPDTPVRYDSKHEGSKYGTSWDLRSASVESFEEEAASFMSRSLDSAQMEEILSERISPDSPVGVQEAPDGIFSQHLERTDSPAEQAMVRDQQQSLAQAVVRDQHQSLSQEGNAGLSQGENNPASGTDTDVKTGHDSRQTNHADTFESSPVDDMGHSGRESEDLCDTVGHAQGHAERKVGSNKRQEILLLRSLQPVEEEHDMSSQQNEPQTGHSGHDKSSQQSEQQMGHSGHDMSSRPSEPQAGHGEHMSNLTGHGEHMSSQQSEQQTGHSGHDKSSQQSEPQTGHGEHMSSQPSEPQAIHGTVSHQLDIFVASLHEAESDLKKSPSADPKESPEPRDSPESEGSTKDSLKESDSSGGASGGSPEIDSGFVFVSAADIPKELHGLNVSFPRGRPPMLLMKEAEPECGTGVEDLLAEHLSDVSGQESDAEFDQVADLMSPESPLPMFTNLPGVSEFVPETAIEESLPEPSDTVDPHAHFTEALFTERQHVFSCRRGKAVSASQIHEDMVVIESTPDTQQRPLVVLESSAGPGRDMVVIESAVPGREGAQLVLDPTLADMSRPATGLTEADVMSPPEEVVQNEANEGIESGQTFLRVEPRTVDRHTELDNSACGTNQSADNCPGSFNATADEFVPKLGAVPDVVADVPGSHLNPEAREFQPQTTEPPGREMDNCTTTPPTGESVHCTVAPPTGERVLPAYTANQVLTNDTTVDEFVLNPGAPEFVPHPGTVEYIPMPLEEDRSPSPNDSETVLDYWTSETSGTIKRRPPIMCTSEGTVMEGNGEDVTPTPEGSPGTAQRRSEVNPMAAGTAQDRSEVITMAADSLHGRSDVNGIPKEFVQPEPLPDAIVDRSPVTPVIPGLTETTTASTHEDKKPAPCSSTAEGRGSSMAEGRGSSMDEGRGSSMAEGRGSSMADGRGSSMAEGRGSSMAEGRGSSMAEGRNRSSGEVKHVTFKLEDEICGYTDTEMFEEIRITKKAESDGGDVVKRSNMAEVMAEIQGDEVHHLLDSTVDPAESCKEEEDAAHQDQSGSREEEDQDEGEYKHVLHVSFSVCEKSEDSQNSADEQNPDPEPGFPCCADRDQTYQHSTEPSNQDSTEPSNQDSTEPTHQDSTEPSHLDSTEPSHQDSTEPSHQDSTEPSHQDSTKPSHQDSTEPSHQDSTEPSHPDSTEPSHQDSTEPSHQDSTEPSHQDSTEPSHQDSTEPSHQDSTESSDHDNVDMPHQDSTGTDTDDSDGPPEGIYRVTPVDDLYSAVNSESADEEDMLTDQQEMVCGRQEQMVPDRQEQMVPDRQEQMLTGRQEQMLTGRQEQMVSVRQEQMLTGRQEQMVSVRQEQMVSVRQEQMVSGRQEQMVSGRQELMLTGCQEQMVTDPQLIVTGRQEQMLIGRQEEEKREEARVNSAVDAESSDCINGNVMTNGHTASKAHEEENDAENGNSTSTDKEEDSTQGFRDFPVYETVTSFRFQANTIRKDPEGPDSESTYINGMYDFSLESAGAVRILPRHESSPYEPVVRGDVISTAARLSREEMQSEQLTTTTRMCEQLSTTTRMTREDIKFIDDDGEETHTTTFLSLRQPQPSQNSARPPPKAAKFVRFAKKEEYVDIDDDDGEAEDPQQAEEERVSPATTPTQEDKENLEITREFDSLEHEANNIEASELDRSSQDEDSDAIKVVVTASHALCQPLSPVTVPVDGIVRAPLAHEEEDEDTAQLQNGQKKGISLGDREIVVIAEIHQSSVGPEEHQTIIRDEGAAGSCCSEQPDDQTAAMSRSDQPDEGTAAMSSPDQPEEGISATSSPDQPDEETAAMSSPEGTAAISSPEQPDEGTAAMSRPDQPDDQTAAMSSSEGTAAMPSPDQPDEGTAAMSRPDQPDDQTAAMSSPEHPDEGTAAMSSPEQPDEGTAAMSSPEGTAAMSCSEDTEDECRSPQYDKTKRYQEVVMGTYYSEGCIEVVMGTYYSEGCILKVVKTKVSSEADCQNDRQPNEPVQNQPSTGVSTEEVTSVLQSGVSTDGVAPVLQTGVSTDGVAPVLQTGVSTDGVAPVLQTGVSTVTPAPGSETQAEAGREAETFCDQEGNVGFVHGSLSDRPTFVTFGKGTDDAPEGGEGCELTG